MVLFVTGICPRKCYFCPVSDEKYGKDITFANEKKCFSSKDIIEEAKLMNAKGAGITGGDPLAKVDRTVRYIKTLKKEFGKDICFHGGLDIQHLLVHGNKDSITSEVRRINSMFKNDGGILFGPSHYITSDVPLENVFAIYMAL